MIRPVQYPGTRYLAMFFVLLVGCVLHGQEAESRAVAFELKPYIDETPPEVTLLSPTFDEEGLFVTDLEKMELLGKVTDDSKIMFVSVNSHILLANENGIFGKTLNLKAGGNIVQVHSMDEHNNKQEIQLKIIYNPPIISLADRINKESRYFGLLIAIEKYRDPDIPDLDNPIRDAERLSRTLTTKYTFNREDVKVLRNPDRGDIIKQLDQLKKEITKRDNLLIFYAGHGFWEEESQIGYWLPADATMESTVDWFRNSALVDYIQAIHSKHTLLITDACFAGSIFKARAVTRKEDFAYETMYDSPSRKAMTSGAMTEVPDESAFVRYLILRLDENRETYLSSQELFASFQKAVISNSSVLPQYGVIQDVGNEGGDFIFLKRQGE